MSRLLSMSIISGLLGVAGSAVPTAAYADGCAKDTDCKGDRICQQGACVEPSAAPAAPAAAAPVPAAGANMVNLTIESNEPSAVLAKIVGRGVAYASGPGGYASAASTDYEMVCTVPCGKAVDRNFQYVFQNVSGMGGLSGTFVLPSQDALTVKVESRSQSGYIWGFLATTLGATGATTGVTFLGVGAAAGEDSFYTGGLVTTAISVPILVAGIWLMVTNGTTVTTSDGEILAD